MAAKKKATRKKPAPKKKSTPRARKKSNDALTQWLLDRIEDGTLPDADTQRFLHGELTYQDVAEMYRKSVEED